MPQPSCLRESSCAQSTGQPPLCRRKCHQTDRGVTKRKKSCQPCLALPLADWPCVQPNQKKRRSTCGQDFSPERNLAFASLPQRVFGGAVRSFAFFNSRCGRGVHPALGRKDEPGHRATVRRNGAPMFTLAKALKKERERLHEMTDRRQCCKPIPQLIEELNRRLEGWKNYFRLWASSPSLTQQSGGRSQLLRATPAIWAGAPVKLAALAGSTWEEWVAPQVSPSPSLPWPLPPHQKPLLMVGPCLGGTSFRAAPARDRFVTLPLGHQVEGEEAGAGDENGAYDGDNQCGLARFRLRERGQVVIAGSDVGAR